MVGVKKTTQYTFIRQASCPNQLSQLDASLAGFFYILSELIPLTVVFICVLILNIRFTSGATNGFILFSQLLGTFDIDVSGIAAFSDSVKHQVNDWTPGYQ